MKPARSHYSLKDKEQWAYALQESKFNLFAVTGLLIMAYILMPVSRPYIPFLYPLALIYFLLKARKDVWLMWNGTLGEAEITRVDIKKKNLGEEDDIVIHYQWTDVHGGVHHAKESGLHHPTRFPQQQQRVPIVYDADNPAHHIINIYFPTVLADDYKALQERKSKSRSS